MVVLLAEDVDRNKEAMNRLKSQLKSSSSRRTWIEIWPRQGKRWCGTVVLLAEDVDRNRRELKNRNAAKVVLLAEDVDRNRGRCEHDT